MRIGIQTWGSFGDTRPFIALAGGLASAGHDVTLASTSVDGRDYSEFSKRLGFRLIDVGSFEFTPERIRLLYSIIGKKSDPLKQLRIILHELFEPLTREMFETAMGLCSDNELVAGHFIMHPTQAAAELTGRPYVTVSLNHSGIPTAYAPPSGLPDMGRWMNSLMWKAGMVFLNKVIRPPINRLRVAAGLRPARSFREVWESRLLNIIAVSPSLCARPPDWEYYHRVTGFLNIPEEREAWPVPDELDRFLDGGEPPVFISFGSMLSEKSGKEYVTETTRIIVDAARSAGCRAVVQSAWGLVEGIPEYPEIYRAGSLPHQLVFPRCSAVVHHGGAGTTQSASMTGKPSVVVAHITDQYFWGDTLNRLGMAPRPLHRHSLSAEKLAGGIREALSTPSMAEKAVEVGMSMRDDDGLANAVRLIEGCA